MPSDPAPSNNKKPERVEVVEKRVAALERLLNIHESIGFTLDLQNVLQILLDEALKATACDRGSLRLLDRDSDELVLMATQGPRTELELPRVSAKDGISARALQRGEPQAVSDVLTDPDYLALIAKHPEDTNYGKFLRCFRSAIKIPILGADGAIGLVCVHGPDVNSFSQCDFTLLRELMRPASWAINNAKVREELGVRRDIERAAATSNNLNALLAAVLEQALTRLGATQGLIRLVDKPRKLLVLAAHGDLSSEGIPLTIPLGAGIVGEVADEARPMLVNDVRRHAGFKRRLDSYAGTRYAEFLNSIGSMVAAPLCTGAEAIGVIMVHQATANAFRREQIDQLCEIAELAAVPIRNAVLNETNGCLVKMIEEFRNLLDLSDEHDAANQLLKYGTELTGARAGYVSRLNSTDGFLRPYVANGMEIDRIPKQSTTIGIDGRAIRESKVQIVTNPYEADPDFRAFRDILSDDDRELLANPQTLAVVPLISGKNLYGVLELHSINPVASPVVIGPLLETFGSFASALLTQCCLQRDEEAAKRLSKRYQLERDEAKGFHELVGESKAFRDLLAKAGMFAGNDETVLVLGETGTGKELIASLIHRMSKRSGKPFQLVDCTTLSEGLREGDLFGAVKGAYTGSDHARVGLFEWANGGTVFIDEIGELDLHGQARLLRVVQEKQIRPLGATQTRRVDVRIVTATHQNLEALVAEGKFREDLWWRLSGCKLQMPPLRERREDIELMAAHFVSKFNRKFNSKVRLSQDASVVLRDYHWPGNVRQLENVLLGLVVLSDRDGEIDGQRLRDALGGDFNGSTPSIVRMNDVNRGNSPATIEEFPGGRKAPTTLSEYENAAARACIEVTLEKTNGNVTDAAGILAVDRSTLERRMKSLGICRAKAPSVTSSALKKGAGGDVRGRNGSAKAGS